MALIAANILSPRLRHSPHVVVDRCPTCQGVFLDRGELETLRQAKSAARGGTAAVSSIAQTPAPGGDTTHPGCRADIGSA